MENISLKHYTNAELLAGLQILVSQERTLSLKVISFLREIRFRSLHLEMGYPSLFTFCIVELKYSEAAAYYRLNALDIVDELPEIKQAIETGELSMTTLSMVQSACKAKKRKTKIKVSAEDKKSLLEKVKGKSKKQTEAILHQHFPELQAAVKPETEKKLSDDLMGIFFNADPELMKKFKEIKDLTAHQNPSPSYQELFHMMSDFMLDRIDPVRKAQRITERSARRQEKRAERMVQAEQIGLAKMSEKEQMRDLQKDLERTSGHEKTPGPNDSLLQPAEVQSKVPTPPETQSRHCSAQTERAVWVRAQSRCEHVDEKTGHRCAETSRLQLDHVVPYAVSHDSSERNIELVCTQHNLYRATQWFGAEFMKQKMDHSKKVPTEF